MSLSLEVGRPLYLKTARQDAIETTGMPFIQVHPWFWVQPRRGARCLGQDLPESAPPPSGTDCLLHRFGLFVGRPFSYDARTTLSRQASADPSTPLEQVRTIRPLAVVGLAFAPIPEFTFQAGWMFARVPRGNGTDTNIGAVVLAVGGTVDLLRNLF